MKLDGLVRPRRRARRNHRLFDGAETRGDGHRDRRVSARVQYLACVNAFDERITAAAQRFERHGYSLIQRSRSCLRETKSLSSKKISSSREALAGLSLPCTRLRPMVCARSPLIEPGAAASGSVAPISCRHPSIAPSPSTASATSGPLVMNETSPSKNGLPLC